MITVVCGFTLNEKVLLIKFLNVGGGQVHWYCKSCKNKALDVMKLIQGLNEKMDLFEGRIDSFTSQVENLTLVKGSFCRKTKRSDQ